jgi:hypothetical protein
MSRRKVSVQILREKADPILSNDVELYDYQGEAYIVAAEQVFTRSHPLNSNTPTNLALDLLREMAGEYEGAAAGVGALQGIGDALSMGLDMVEAHDDIDIPKDLTERMRSALAEIHSELNLIRAITTTTLES